MGKGPIPVGYSKVVAEGRYGPASWANVFYLDTVPSDPGFPGDAALAAAAAIKELYTLLKAHIFSEHFIVTRERVFYRSDDTSVYNFTIADGTAGIDASGDQDAQVCFLVNWITGDPRRGGKPRQYFCGVTDDMMQDSAILNPALLPVVNGILATWLGGFPYSGGATGVAQGLVEMEFRNNKAWLPEGFPRPVLGGTLSPVVATQRRRVDRLR